MFWTEFLIGKINFQTKMLKPEEENLWWFLFGESWVCDFCTPLPGFLTVWLLQVALVYGQMNEPPGARARVALTGLTVAEYFRDQEGQDVLLFIDNIFRFTQAGSEVRGHPWEEVHWAVNTIPQKDVDIWDLCSFFLVGICLIGQNPFCCRLSAYLGHWHGYNAGTNHHYQEGIYHLCAGKKK